MSILNPTPQEIEDDKIRTYRDYWNPGELKEVFEHAIEDYVKPTQRTFVVAGTHAEYNAWLIRKGYSKTEYVYVASTDNLRGISAEDLKGIYIGTWRNRSDIDEIRQMIAFIKTKAALTTVIPVTGQIVTGSSGTAIYVDDKSYPISIGGTLSNGAGGVSTFGSNGGIISSVGAAGAYDIMTTYSNVQQLVQDTVRSKIRVDLRTQLHDEIETLSYGDTTRAVILAAIDRVLDKY